MDIGSTVKQFILEKMISTEAAIELAHDTPLVEIGILNSLSVLQLISFLEEEFKVEFVSEDVDAGGFSSLASIERLVSERLGRT